MRKLFLFLTFLAVGATLDAAPDTVRAPLAPDPYYVQIARRFARQFPQEHLRNLSMDERVSARAWTNYLSALDADRSFFLASDIEGFRIQETALGDRLAIGDIDFAYRVYATFMARVSNRFDYVASLLTRELDVTGSDTYEWKRRDAPWPADEAAWDDLWRKKILNEYVQQLVSREVSPPSTNAPAAGAGPAPSPQTVIQKRYRQLLTVLQDNDAEWVLQKYLDAFTRAYDPHSTYMPLSSIEDFDIEMKLSLVGIGALLSAEDGAAKVVRIIPGGPADLDKRDHRLQPNDRIVAVAEGASASVDVLHWPLHKIVKLIRGERGTRVVLTVIPASDPTASTTKIVDLVRDEVKLEEQAASARYETLKDSGGIPRLLGIVTLPAFYANMRGGSVGDDDFKSSAYDVARILDAMVEKRVDGVLLDLRSNGGGALMEAVKMAGLFFDTGPTVQVKERFALRVLPDMDPTRVYAGPLVVLVNRLSASASEIVAGALQDYGRAIVVGDSKTHGKGTVQSILDLGRDRRLGAIRVTTASYYRISGGSTQLKGISPDIVVHSPFDFMEYGEEYLPNPMEWSTVPPARYRPVADLRAVIPPLKESSARRQESDPRFAAYRKLLERIETINKTAALPLNLDARRALAKSERELLELEERLDADRVAPADTLGDKRADLVLDEALQILADSIALTAAAPAPAAPAEMPWPDRLRGWIRSLFGRLRDGFKSLWANLNASRKP